MGGGGGGGGGGGLAGGKGGGGGGELFPIYDLYIVGCTAGFCVRVNTSSSALYQLLAGS